MPKLSKTLPPEQSQTIENYEFQISESTRASLGMLDDGSLDHIVCEWHDDYVEVHLDQEDEVYTFVQVKGRSNGKSLFSYKQVFGLTKLDDKQPSKPAKKAASKKKTTKNKITVRAVDTDSIVLKQFSTFLRFPEHRKKFLISTNYDFAPEVYEFLEYIKSGQFKNDDLNYKRFEQMLKSYEKVIGKEDLKENLTEYLKNLQLKPNVNDLNDYQLKLERELRNRLEEINEIPYFGDQISRFVTDLMRLVRKKSKKRNKRLPDNDEVFTKDKVVTLKDVLDHIGVSQDFYEKYKTADKGRRESLVASTRIKRFFDTINMDGENDAFDYKFEYDQWVLDNSASLGKRKEAAIKSVFVGVVRNATANDSLSDLIENAKRQMPIVFDDYDNDHNEQIIAGGIIATVCELGNSK